jgi:hypothetical protein
MGDGGSGAFNQVKVAFGADGKPGVPPVVKGFGDGIEADDFAVKSGAFLQIAHIKGKVVENGFLCVHKEGGEEKKGRNSMADHSLINIGELAKPATVLIEKISDAVGEIYKPYQAKRVAKAETEAELTSASEQKSKALVACATQCMRRARFARLRRKRARLMANVRRG